MQIIEKNEGQKLAYSVRGTKLELGDGDIVLNLAKFERDTAVHIDIVSDEYDCLATSIGGSTEGKRYAAEVDIPEREYVEIQNPDAVPAAETGEGMSSAPSTISEPVPFDMTRCTLTLWAMT